MKKSSLIPLILFFLAALLVSNVSAQSRSVFWKQWDVLINDVNTVENRFTVTEKYDIEFTGNFHFGTVFIPFTRLDSITNVAVAENGQALRADCSQADGTFCVETTPDGLSVRYYFLHPLTDTAAKFEIVYQVNGALRIYEGGDQLWWIAIPSDHYGFSIGSSTITVILPGGFAPRQGVDPVETYGVPGTVEVQGTTVTATANRPIIGDETFEIRVQFPHQSNARVSKRQQAFDSQTNEKFYSWFETGTTILFVVSIVGGLLATFYMWM